MEWARRNSVDDIFFKSGLLHLLNPMALTLFKIGLKMNSNYTPLMFLVLLIHEAFFFTTLYNVVSLIYLQNNILYKNYLLLFQLDYKD